MVGNEFSLILASSSSSSFAEQVLGSNGSYVKPSIKFRLHGFAKQSPSATMVGVWTQRSLPPPSNKASAQLDDNWPESGKVYRY